MPQYFFPAQIDHFRHREAKLISTSHAISHSAALDQIALTNGFANWSLLAEHNRPFVELVTLTPPLRLHRSAEEWTRALNAERQTLHRRRSDDAEVENICFQLVAPFNAATFALDYMRGLIERAKRFPIRHRAKLEMYAWLPYSVHDVASDVSSRIILNRAYKPVGSAERGYVDYEDFQHLHAALDVTELRRFSNKEKGSGFLFADANPPWLSRECAEAYVRRLEELCNVLVARSSHSTSPPWTRTHEGLYEELAPWARVPTAFTSHPADERRFAQVLESLRELGGTQLSEGDIRIVLKQHRNDALEILGGKPTDARLDAYVRRILEALT